MQVRHGNIELFTDEPLEVVEVIEIVKFQSLLFTVLLVDYMVLLDVMGFLRVVIVIVVNLLVSLDELFG